MRARRDHRKDHDQCAGIRATCETRRVLSTANIAIIVAGVVGPGLGYIAAWRGDRRRFGHERTLKASDDLIARLDGVATALENLGSASAELRQIALAAGPRHEQVQPRVLSAEDAYQVARASIARLGMRPHAGEDVMEIATAAATMMLDAIRIVRSAALDDAAAHRNLGSVVDLIDSGYDYTTRFQEQARAAIADLLSTGRATRRLTILGQPLMISQRR